MVALPSASILAEFVAAVGIACQFSDEFLYSYLVRRLRVAK